MKNSSSSLATVGTITCPSCKNVFDVSEILVHRIKENLQVEYQSKFDEIQKLKKQVLKQHSEIESQIEKGIELKLKAQKLILQKQIREHVESENSEQIKSYKEQLKAQVEKTKELLRLKAEFEKIQREHETMKEQFEVDFQSRLSKELSEARTKIKSEVEKSAGFKVAEQSLLIESLRTEVSNAKRRLDQGSQQMSGEAAEITIENWLKENFPGDDLLPIKKGEKGADVVLVVKDAQGSEAGRIVFESKRTKSWSGGWLEKMAEDIRKKSSGQLTFGILISEVYPKDVTKMTQLNSIWVCSFLEYRNLVVVLRQSILLLYEMQNSHMNKGNKMELMHQFLTGPSFKGAVESIISSFKTMKSDLDSEKAVLQKYWKSREVQLEKVLTNTAEMYHSIRNIIGSKVPVIKQLEEPEDNV